MNRLMKASMKGPVKAGVIIVAAGQSQRFRRHDCQLLPKPYVSVKGQPLLAYSVNFFRQDPRFSARVVVIDPQHEALFHEAVPGERWVAGGASRQESVACGLRALGQESLHEPLDVVFIHDAARPLLSLDVIDRLFHALQEGEGAVPVIPVVDTLRHKTTLEDFPRAEAVLVQTPQAFRYDVLSQVYKQAQEQGIIGTDDGALMTAVGKQYTLVDGCVLNRKVTYAEDLLYMEKML